MLIGPNFCVVDVTPCHEPLVAWPDCPSRRVHSWDSLHPISLFSFGDTLLSSALFPRNCLPSHTELALGSKKYILTTYGSLRTDLTR